VRKRELPLEYVVLPDPHNEGCEQHPGRLLGRQSGKTRKEGRPLRLPFLLFLD